MERAMQTGASDEPQRAAERIKPEAQDIAKKSIQGIMSKFLKQVRIRRECESISVLVCATFCFCLCLYSIVCQCHCGYTFQIYVLSLYIVVILVGISVLEDGNISLVDCKEQ